MSEERIWELLPAEESITTVTAARVDPRGRTHAGGLVVTSHRLLWVRHGSLLGRVRPVVEWQARHSAVRGIGFMPVKSREHVVIRLTDDSVLPLRLWMRSMEVPRLQHLSLKVAGYRPTGESEWIPSAHAG